MPKRILVIEDEAGFREVLEDVLDHAGYEVETSPYLASAVCQATIGKYDLITLDLRMPGVHGLDVAQIFHGQGLCAKILVISGYLNTAVTLQLKQLGIKHFLDKPADVGQLIQAVKNALLN